MSLNLSPIQQYCLDSIGIESWQLREQKSEPFAPAHVTAKKMPISKPQSQPQLQPKYNPLLVQELERAIAYCQQQGKTKVGWNVVPGANDLSVINNVLQLPALERVFANATLKKQLWSLLVKNS